MGRMAVRVAALQQARALIRLQLGRAPTLEEMQRATRGLSPMEAQRLTRAMLRKENNRKT